MKKLLIFLAALIMLCSFVAARVGPIDEECASKCGSKYTGIAKWEYNGTSYYNESDPKGTYVTGTSYTAYWTSNTNIDCIVVKDGRIPGTNDFAYNISYDVGASGIATLYPYKKEISHLTFCKSETHEIPEFGVVASLIALIGASAIFFVVRK